MASFIGEIKPFAGSTLPQGWLLCNGEYLDSSNEEYHLLFTVIGTLYGGEAPVFRVPSLMDRLPVHHYPEKPLGTLGGKPEIVLATKNLPEHTHRFVESVPSDNDFKNLTYTNAHLRAKATLYAVSEPGNTNAPAGGFLANTGATDPEYRKAGHLVTMHKTAVEVTDDLTAAPVVTHPASSVSAQGLPIPLPMPPHVVMRYIICYQGVMPIPDPR